MLACQKNPLHLNKLEKAVVVFICQQSDSLYNSALYEVRQQYLKSSQTKIDDEGIVRRSQGHLAKYSFSCHTLKNNKNYKSLFAQAAQQTLKSLVESLKSYKALLKKFFKSRRSQIQEFYGSELIEVTESYTKQASSFDDDNISEYGEQPSGWKPLGKSSINQLTGGLYLGLYRTEAGYPANADELLACTNLLSKVNRKLKFNLNFSRVSRGYLTAPARVYLWVRAHRCTPLQKTKQFAPVKTISCCNRLESPSIYRWECQDYEPRRSKLGQERLGKNNLQDFMGILNGSRSKGKNLFKMERR